MSYRLSKLRCDDSSRLKNSFLLTRIPSGCRFKAPHIRAVPKFGLCITSDIFILLGLFKEQFVLFWCALVT